MRPFSYYSASTRGFYRAHLHGAPRVLVADPDWRPPKRRRKGAAPAEHPTVEVDNPATTIPPDAVALTEDEHRALMAGQASGQEIVPGPDGRPILQDPAEPVLPNAVRRRVGYGPLGDMLDMIYRDLKAAGIDGEFVRHVDAVKAAHPKEA